MVDSTLPDPLRGRTVPDRRLRDTRRAFEWADSSAFDFWPGLPRCVSRALALIILLAMLPGLLAALSRGAHALPGEVPLANAGQPPSVRLVDRIEIRLTGSLPYNSLVNRCSQGEPV